MQAFDDEDIGMLGKGNMIFKPQKMLSFGESARETTFILNRFQHPFFEQKKLVG